MVIWDIYRRRIQGRSLRGIFADMDTAPQARQTFSNTGNHPAQSPYQLMFQHRGVCRVYCGGIRATMGSEAIQHLDPPPNTQIHRNSQKMQTMSEVTSHRPPPPRPVLAQRPSAKGLVLRAPDLLLSVEMSQANRSWSHREALHSRCTMYPEPCKSQTCT